MIVFDLKCEQGHQFESWFRSSSAYEEQLAMALVECPHCGSVDIMKAPMAPNVAAKSNQQTGKAVPASASVPEAGPVATAKSAMTATPELQQLVKQAEEAMAKVQRHVEENCENVGKNFAEEARKIHYGETEERGIYGESSLEEAKDLLDEGIEVMPLPGARRTDA